MAASAFPSIFVSHGAPTLAIEPTAAHRFLQGLGRRLGRPRAIVVVSAHWETRVPTVGLAATPSTIHDFYGFPDALYRIRYQAPGAPELAERVGALLDEAGISHAVDASRGLDHGVWVPLTLMYPDADIPVVPLSVQPGRSAADHLAVGRALSPLRHEGVLILGSGGAVHNLGALRPDQDATQPWAQAFDEWLDATLVAGRVDDIAEWRRLAPHALMAHPSDEHFLPLPVALGAAGERPRVERLHQSWERGNLALRSYAFAEANEMAAIA